MNWEHFKTIVWLRWRTRFNQIKRTGVLNAVLTVMLVVSGLVASFVLFFVALGVGIATLHRASDLHLFYLWNAIVIAFLFVWAMGLFTELQRSDGLSFDKLLHLPISLSGVFFLNFAGSLVSFTLVLFLPGMVGLMIAMVLVKGPALLVAAPLLAGFVLMVTATTYQLKGWLATLMVNKRRRRTIIAVITFGFILLCQAPNLINLAYWRTVGKGGDAATKAFEEASRVLQERSERLTGETNDNIQALKNGEIDLESFNEQNEVVKQEMATATLKLEQHEKAQKQAKKEEAERQLANVHAATKWASILLPPGWLAYGIQAAAGYNLWPGLLGATGLFLIGGVSLRRSYRTTLRFYRGEYQSGGSKRRVAAVAREATPATPKQKASARSLERKIPGISESSSVVALATFRSLWRGPESKMALLAPVLILAILAVVLFMSPLSKMPSEIRPLLAFGVIGAVMFGVLQIMVNQFGFDRDGFRCYVLSPIPRRDIFIGKNLSMAPFVLGFGAAGLTALQFALPQRPTHFLASLFEMASVYLVCCMMGNFVSMFAAWPMAFGAMRKQSPKLSIVLIQLAFLMMMPFGLAPVLLPVGIHYLFEYLGWAAYVPIYLILSVALFAGIASLYFRVLDAQGRLLQAREQKILEAVTAKAE